jgi:hypothetical protein
MNGITIKGGNVTRLSLLDRILDLTEDLSDKANGKFGSASKAEIVAIANVYKNVAKAVSTIETNTQGISIASCQFTGVDMGIKIESAPIENLNDGVEECIIKKDEVVEVAEEIKNNESSEVKEDGC